MNLTTQQLIDIVYSVLPDAGHCKILESDEFSITIKCSTHVLLITTSGAVHEWLVLDDGRIASGDNDQYLAKIIEKMIRDRVTRDVIVVDGSSVSCTACDDLNCTSTNVNHPNNQYYTLT